MGLFKRLTGYLGFARDEEAENNSHLNGASSSSSSSPSTVAAAAPFASASQAANHLPRKGFSVPVQVPVAVYRAPILVQCNAGDGGVQGFGWYTMRLRVDEEGDIADEFLDEVLTDMSVSMEEDRKSAPRFEVKYSSRPAKVRNQALSSEGKLQHCVEYQGRLEWV